MRGSPDSRPAFVRVTRHWLGAALGLTLAIGAGLLIAQLLMTPPAGDMRSLAAYLTLSGAATMGAGWLALRAADRLVGLSIPVKTFLGAAIGNAVALINVFVIAQLMFVSTSHDLRLLVAVIVFSAIVTCFFILWAASTIVRRMEAVAEGIRSLAAGTYEIDVVVEGGDEVAQLGEDVNRLARRLAATEEQRRALDRERRELTAAISHDLRTPLSSLRAMIEALIDDVVVDSAEVRRYYASIRREIDRLSRMIDDLFELAQIDAGARRLERRALALQEIAAETVDAMQAQARSAGVGLRLSIEGEPPELPLEGASIERITANLIRNALDHTPEGGDVDVSVFTDNGYVALRVSDSGEGVETKDRERIWERFYRVDDSRQRGAGSTDGAGLGLAIVRGLVELHGGTVEVSSAPGEGAAFTARLPRE